LGEVPFIMPATARTCKHYPGFLREEDPESGHGVFDTLVRQAAFESVVELAAKRSAEAPVYLYDPHCPCCSEKVDAPPFQHYALLGNTHYCARPVEQRLSRTAINRTRWAAQTAQLYTLSLLSQQTQTDLQERLTRVNAVTTLRGEVLASDRHQHTVMAALERIERLGGGRSRGLGRCRIAVSEAPEGDDPLAGADVFAAQVEAGRFEKPEKQRNLSDRLRKLNWLLQVERDFWKRTGAEALPGRWYFTIDLLADAILRDCGLPTLHLSPEMAGFTGDGLPPVSLALAHVNRTYRSGWSGAKGLPRPVHLAAARGSVYFYEVAPADRFSVLRLLERLVQLEAEGVGLERERGLGRVMVCAPFHLEIEAV
jgi:CRISPR-associated protein Csx10